MRPGAGAPGPIPSARSSAFGLGRAAGVARVALTRNAAFAVSNTRRSHRTGARCTTASAGGSPGAMAATAPVSACAHSTKARRRAASSAVSSAASSSAGAAASSTARIRRTCSTMASRAAQCASSRGVPRAVSRAQSCASARHAAAPAVPFPSTTSAMRPSPIRSSATLRAASGRASASSKRTVSTAAPIPSTRPR